MFGVTVAERDGRDHVEPGIVIEIDDQYVTIVDRCRQAAIAADVRKAGQRERAVGQHAVLVHQQDVGAFARRGEGLLAHDDQVDVAVLIQVAPRVVFLVDIEFDDAGIGRNPVGRVLDELDPLSGGHAARGEDDQQSERRPANEQRHSGIPQTDGTLPTIRKTIHDYKFSIYPQSPRLTTYLSYFQLFGALGSSARAAIVEKNGDARPPRS